METEQYRTPTSPYKFMPVVIETVGVLGDEGLHSFDNWEDVLPMSVANQGFFHLLMQHVSINNKCGNAACCYMMETAADCIVQFHWVLWLICFFRRIAILQLTSSATSVKLLVTRSPKYFLSKQELFLTGIKSVQYWTNLKHLSLGQWCLIDVLIGRRWMAHVFVKIVPLLGGGTSRAAYLVLR